MKKYEYRIIQIDRLMKEMSLVMEKDTSELILFQAVLDNLGKEGWDLIMVRGDVIGKREIS